MFCDQTSLYLKAGNGGGGSISLLRAKFLAKGGPDGGNGGRGGNVILKANCNLNSLIHLHTKKKFNAENGEGGQGRQLHGKGGEDITLEIPVGTIIRDSETQEVLYDFRVDKEEFIIAKGGRGGYGNEHFKSSIRQTPRFAELGEPGQEIFIDLELKLIADVGIIGLPSAGKSTLISQISAAKPKIAAYHFTTLIPNLGVVKLSNNRTFVACDIPGLIEGASEGKGLGDEFLRHISRSKICIHLVDISLEQPLNDYKIIRKELKNYSQELADKKEIIVFSKIDTLGGDDELLGFLQDEFEKELGIRPLGIASFAGSGLHELKEELWKIIEEIRVEERKIEEEKRKSDQIQLFQPHLDKVDPKFFIVTKEIQQGDQFGTPRREGFRITGQRFEQIVIQTDLQNREATMRIRDIIHKMGIQKKLLAEGAVNGTTLFVGTKHFDFEPLVLKK
ncbi:TPA: GTPase ObgE [Candidatus Peregrinibacteria bacterium]|nr:GTPase ObgE [Candidatus Peregrinibacteria bacterium]HIQ57569.1 GTPase ObgE [Candidatus Gracilibacteria bacterium]